MSGRREARGDEEVHDVLNLDVAMPGRHVKDARVRRTQRRLRDAIVSLIHEKSYPAIAVKEILVCDRAARIAYERWPLR